MGRGEVSSVVSLTGAPVVDKRKPDEEVIAVARRILELAEAGELRGMMVSGLCHDDASYGIRVGLLNYTVIGRLEELKMLTLEDLA